MKKVSLVFILCFCIIMLTSCSNEAESSVNQYSEYVQAYLEARYLGNCDEYMTLSGATQENAELFHTQNNELLAQELKEYYSIATSDSGIYERLKAVAEVIYSKASFSAEDTQLVNDVYTVTVKIQPLDFFDQVSAAYSTYASELNQRVIDGEFKDVSEDEYELTYADGILKILEEYAPKTGNKSTVTRQAEFLFNSENNAYYLSDDCLESIAEAILCK